MLRGVFVMMITTWVGLASASALTTLFNDGFSGTSSVPLNWIYGDNSLSQPVGAGDTFAVNTTSGVLSVVDVSPFGTSSVPILFHTTQAMDFRATGDKIIQLNADITIGNNVPDYRIGLFDSTVSGYFVAGNCVVLRIYPGLASNNVVIFAKNGAGALGTYATFSTAPSNLTGTHTFALQLDYSTSTTAPTVRAYSNAVLLGQVTLAATEGIRPATTGTTQGTAIRILSQCTSTTTVGGSFALDNVTVTSFSPGAILLGQLQRGDEVNRLIFGHNSSGADTTGIFTSGISLDEVSMGHGFWDPTSTASPTGAPASAVLARCRDEVGIKSLRYPGGCGVHNFNWKGTIGPLSARANAGWNFGLDEFLVLCAQLGAEPVITLSDYVLPADQMPRHLAELVEYLNAPATPAHPWAMQRAANGHAAPYGVKYFELGNESIHGNHFSGSAKRIYTPEQYADYASKSAWAMRAIDPSVQVGVVMAPGGGQDVYRQWNTAVLQLAGAASDFVVLHLYAPRYVSGDKATFSESNLMQACMAVGEQIAGHLQEYHDLIVATCGHDLLVAVTEYNAIFTNTDPGVAPYKYSLAAGLECADLMRIFLDPDNKVLMANYWQIVNDYFGMLQFTSRPGAEPFTEKPAYPLYRLWGQHFGTTLLNVSVTGPRSDFGGERRTYPAQGDTYQPEQFLTSTDLTPLIQNNLPNLNKSTVPTVTASLTNGGATDSILQVNLTNFTGYNYPCIAMVNAPASANGAPCSYELTYDGRFTQTSANGAVFDLLVEDARDWSSSMAFAAVGAISSSWQTFQGEMVGLSDTPGIATLIEMPAGTNVISGRLEIRKARLDIYKQPVYPAYNLLTSAASVSADGHTVYMIVFNKSNLHIPTTISFNGFTALSARRWEVNGPGLAATSGVSEVVSNAVLALNGGSGAKHVFPAHSMTAIEFTR